MVTSRCPLRRPARTTARARAAGALAVTHLELAEGPRPHLMSARSSLHASLTLCPTCDISFDAVQFRA